MNDGFQARIEPVFLEATFDSKRGRGADRLDTNRLGGGPFEYDGRGGRRSHRSECATNLRGNLVTAGGRNQRDLHAASLAERIGDPRGHAPQAEQKQENQVGKQ